MNQNGYPVGEVAQITGATLPGGAPVTIIRTLATDSRKIEDPAHALFFALKGRRDGHAFIREAYDAGVRSFIVSNNNHLPGTYPDANILRLTDPLEALQRLAAWHRSQFEIPVIAITGSNGKTIVKEWLYQLLAPDKNIIRSPKSYNSQIGVPLSVWKMNAAHELAIFEAGISTSYEMQALERVIRPTIGILTTIGDAHNEGFTSREEKIREKLSLFNSVSLFIYSPDHLANYEGDVPGKKKFTWSLSGNADLVLTRGSGLENGRFKMICSYRQSEIETTIPFADAASVQNALCCLATMLALEIPAREAVTRLEKILPVKMRLELKKGINNCSIIDDSYSLDISSLAIALDFLKQQNQHEKRTLILSDIPETGIHPSALYQDVAELLKSKSVDRLIGIGEHITANRALFDPGSVFFAGVEELLGNKHLSFSNETILLKGARAFCFERISSALTQVVHETVLEINLTAIEHNLNYYKSLLKPDVRIMAIVKAFSYGSGSFEIANLLQFNKIDYLAVAFADEGVALRKAGITLPIMVMNADRGAFDLLIGYNLEPELFSNEILREFSDELKSRQIKAYPVHIKLDTGMHRLGFMPEEVPELGLLLASAPEISVRSVFSHLVSSEDAAEDPFTALQIGTFEDSARRLQDALGYPFLLHMANTSGISRHPRAQYDMVRLGIGLYGIDSAQPSSAALHTAAVLRTRISQVKSLQRGDTVGYNRKGVVWADSRIATVKIGYADGYNRKFGNGAAHMLVNGQLVPTIGNICMDMSMLDVTGTDAKAGDDVIVFGEGITVSELAAILGTIPYEILTGISQRVKRVYFSE